MGVEWRKGAWHLRLKHLDGKWRYSKTECATKAEANALYVLEAARLDRQRRGFEPVEVNPKGWSLWKLLEDWLDTYGVKLAEHSRATSTLKKHVKPTPAAALRLDLITPAVVKKLVQGVDAGAVVQRHVRGYLSRAFNQAIADGVFFGANPVAKVKRTKLPKKEPVFLELEEIAALFAHLDKLGEHEDDRIAKPAKARALVYAIALGTGARRGEIWALRWGNVDLKRGVITIAQSNDRPTTKSGEPRFVEIAPFLRKVLEKAKPANVKREDLVCPGRGGELRSSDAKAAQQLRLDLAGAEVPRDIRFHDLRHTFASWWLMKGNTLESLQEALGHSTIELTRSRYGHLSRPFVSAQWARFNLDPEPVAVVVGLKQAGSIRGAK